MGSGGPRGLQILRSGVKSVRGGFDSHAFPPSRRGAAWLAPAIAAGLLWGGPGLPARAAAEAPDSLAVGAPSATQDTALVRARRGRFETPRWVMLRSLAVPGWGQLHNGSWLKAALLGGGEVWLIAGLAEDSRQLGRLKAEADRALQEGDTERQNAAVDAYNNRLARVVSRQWLLGGVLAYALVDAYVDAHFRDFKLEFEHDPALPGGRPPTGQTRLSLRWDF
jgi:hypothetical protein